MFPPASGPLSSTMWSQVVRILPGLIHGINQVHTVYAAQLALSAHRHSQE